MDVYDFDTDLPPYKHVCTAHISIYRHMMYRPDVMSCIYNAKNVGLARVYIHQICLMNMFMCVYAEQDIATKFFRTLSSHGKRPDPASRAALHGTRVRSAVMTPSRQQRQERETQALYDQMSRSA